MSMLLNCRSHSQRGGHGAWLCCRVFWLYAAFSLSGEWQVASAFPAECDVGAQRTEGLEQGEEEGDDGDGGDGAWSGDYETVVEGGALRTCLLHYLTPCCTDNRHHPHSYRTPLHHRPRRHHRNLRHHPRRYRVAILYTLFAPVKRSFSHRQQARVRDTEDSPRPLFLHVVLVLLLLLLLFLLLLFLLLLLRKQREKQRKQGQTRKEQEQERKQWQRR